MSKLGESTVSVMMAGNNRNKKVTVASEKRYSRDSNNLTLNDDKSELLFGHSEAPLEPAERTRPSAWYAFP